MSAARARGKAESMVGQRVGSYVISTTMIGQYGPPGETDPEGFDPYADTVGPGIYGGNVKRDEDNNIIIGQQYQNHNRRPGPVYDGTGYTITATAIHRGTEAVEALLEKDPSLINEVSTGGATPLHLCGMSQRGQLSTELFIRRGGNIEAIDTYGYRPLHRMASNNLAVGAEVLLKAGADVNAKTQDGETPLSVAKTSSAWSVVKVLQTYGAKE